MTMGDRLRELRLRKKLSQEEVARHIGITRSAYSHYEINNRQPIYETLIKLSVFFQVSLDYIIGGESIREEQMTADTLEVIQLFNTMNKDQRKQSISKMREMIAQND